MFDGADCSVLKLFLGVRGVKVARVTGSVDSELARWFEGRMMQEENVEEEGVCGCGNESGVVRCGDCNGRICVGEELGEGKKWFGGMGRNAWQFGNR